MATYLLTWNPERWRGLKEMADLVAQSASGEIVPYSWSTGRRTNMAKGDRVYLVRQKSERGLLGSGYTDGPVFQAEHWDESRDDLANFVNVLWDVLLPVEDVLPVKELIAANLSVDWQRMQGSGVEVPAESANRLEELWQAHLQQIRRIDVLPNEVAPGGRYIEGAVAQILVNAYERNPMARWKCIEAHGTDCGVCGFNFAAFYGEIGEGFIHVHHLRDLARIGKAYEVNPVADLRPVCPNCHAMLHRTTPAMSIAALKKQIKK